MSHVHTPPSESDNLDMFTQEFWDARYRSANRIWSGNPNPHLVARVADLSPGTALDVGCGEGADAIWLASLGWQVRDRRIDRGVGPRRRTGRHGWPTGGRPDHLAAGILAGVVRSSTLERRHVWSAFQYERGGYDDTCQLDVDSSRLAECYSCAATRPVNV